MSEEYSKQKAAMDGAKKRIQRLERFLEGHCPASVREIVSLWQYESGQAPRKTKEYMESIRAAGKIEFYENNEEDWVRLAEPEESFTEYAHRKQREKEDRMKNELRVKFSELRRQM